MTRRGLLLFAIREPETVPTDPARLNEFASAYNLFAGALAKGLIDLRLWRSVVRAWERMTK